MKKPIIPFNPLLTDALAPSSLLTCLAGESMRSKQKKMTECSITKSVLKEIKEKENRKLHARAFWTSVVQLDSVMC